MRRARHPLPYEMWGIRWDSKKGKYSLSERGITYYLDIEHTRLLKQYFRSNCMKYPNIEKWYHDLDSFTRKEIERNGNLESMELDFYPDPQFD